jgi:hypothetical protein
MPLAADQGVLAVRSEPSVGTGLASGAGQVVVSAGSAVIGPSAALEVPAAEGPKPFFAALSNTWRGVNSWKKRSPRARVACLRRRSQWHRLTWRKMMRIAERWLPSPKLRHSYPDWRFVMTRGGSPVR